MSGSPISVTVEGAIMRVCINNPPVNLMTIAMVQELFALVGRLNFDSSIKVVIFESAITDFFIAHFDSADFMRAAANEAAQSKFEDINILQSLVTSIQGLPQITIAKIKGVCRGGGLELVLGMTMRFASVGARFCAVESSLGFLPCGGGSTRLALACGPARTLEVLLGADDVSAEVAAAYGIINRALANKELDSYVDGLATRIAQRSPATIALNREVVNRTLSAFEEALFAGFAAENDGMHKSMAGGDAPRLVKAVLDAGQDRNAELDLPRTIDRILAAQPVSG